MMTPYSETITIRIKECPQCKASHDFPIEILYESIRLQTFSGLGLPAHHSDEEPPQTCEVVVKCPLTTKDVIITIPASMLSGKPTSIRPGR